MLTKTCPWCGEKCSFNQLGSRPAKFKPKWYQFSRSVKVCPYCAGGVKPGGKGLWLWVLIVPLFVVTFAEIFIGYSAEKAMFGNDWFWWLAGIGFAGSYLFCQFEKVEDC